MHYDWKLKGGKHGWAEKNVHPGSKTFNEKIYYFSVARGVGCNTCVATLVSHLKVFLVITVIYI